MARKQKQQRQRSVVKGVLAGLAGGIAGAAAKSVAEKVFPPRNAGQTPPAVLAEEAAGHPLNERQQTVAIQGIHWAFGALAGAVYGAAVEMEPKASAWRGAVFGLTLNRLTHESILPRMGLTGPAALQPTQERLSEWVTHVVYGVTTDTVRRMVRRSLG